MILKDSSYVTYLLLRGFKRDGTIRTIWRKQYYIHTVLIKPMLHGCLYSISLNASWPAWKEAEDLVEIFEIIGKEVEMVPGYE